MPNPPPLPLPHALTLQNPSKKSACPTPSQHPYPMCVPSAKPCPLWSRKPQDYPKVTGASARPLCSLIWLTLLVYGMPVAQAGETWGMVSICPFHCVCRNLSESLSTLCVNKGLLFVPPDIDRRTVELRLADNFIVEVGGSDFANMTGLVDLTLSRNTLHALRPLAFSDLESLRSLHLDSNRLTAVGPQDLSGLLNLQHLILNNNQLTDVSDQAFGDFLLTLEDLDLSYNNLREAPWDAVQNMASLHTLNLDHNLIEHIPEGAFGELYKLARLDMTSNRLQTLPPDPLFARSQPGVISPTPYNPVTSLNFGGNPLHCNCELLWLRRLVRPDDMETCATPAHLAGRYFWSVPEEEFTCEPPLIARHTHQLWVLEGQRATLRCRAIGDPEPLVHWVSPDDRIVANSSRVYSYRNGTLDVLVTRARDDGTYTCIAINAAGEATASVDLRIIPLPHRGNRTAPLAQNRDTGPSDISAGKGGTREGGGAGNGTGGGSDAGVGAAHRVGVEGVTATTADIHWHVGAASLDYLPWMYQIQYNSTADETLMYRILPATSDGFRLKNLVSGADYTLCVLAVYDDGVTSLAATKVLGCTQFSTKDDFPKCRSLQAHFLGGTLSVLVGGAVVVMLLVFTVAAMVRHHRTCNHHDDGHVSAGDRHRQTGSPLPAKGTSVYSQTNGDGAVMMVVLPNGTQLPPKPKTKHKPKAPPKPKHLTEPYGGGAGEGGGFSLTMAIPEKRFPPYTPESERVTLYYTPAHASATLPYKLSRTGKQKARRPGEAGLEAAAEGVADRGAVAGLGGASTDPTALRSKRSSSFDMGEVATTTCYSYAKRLSVIWTRRSQSLHGMLVHCASATSTSSSGSDQHTHAVPRGYLHAHSGSDSAHSAIANSDELEESVV